MHHESRAWWKIVKTFDTQCGDGPGGGGATTNELTFESAGYPLNVNLLSTSTIGDFLPPSPTLGGSSVALVPPGMANSSTGWSGASRPTLEGAVDLVSGLPLASFSDLELPFGGATFRLTRTRSENPKLAAYSSCEDTMDSWAWAGDRWMIGESPILLIDSAVPDVVGSNPRTTYLVLDAHHSIPFQRLESGKYEAPARFRARLWQEGGVWNPTQQTWSSFPKRYNVSLYDGALTYRFVAVHEDVPDHWYNDPATSGPRLASMHESPILPPHGDNINWDPLHPPENPGQGVPYYGLCTSIEDQHGHRVEIELHPHIQYERDNPQSNDADPQSPDCIECMQSGPAKGQIRSIRLVRPLANNQSEVSWTLLYRYRTAPRTPWKELFQKQPCEATGLFDWTRIWKSMRFDDFGPRVLDSIHVYRDDRSFHDLEMEWFTLTTDRKQPVAVPGDAAEALDGEPVPAPDPAPPGWLHRVRYHYAFQHEANEVLPDGEMRQMLHPKPRLLKVSAESRPDASLVDPERFARTERLFEYSIESGTAATGIVTPRLVAMYDPAALSRALSVAERLNAADRPGSSDIALALDGISFGGSLGDVSASSLPKVRAMATVRWDEKPEAGQDLPAWKQSAPGMSSSYIRTANAFEIATDTDGQTGRLILAGADGQSRYFVLRRFVVPPVPGKLPMRSAFHVPYSWNAYQRAEQSPDTTEPPADFMEPRWITVIDEYRRENVADAIGGTANDGVSSPDLIARRVVQVGASGLILRDHSWAFNQGTAHPVAGSGYGAENVYLSMKDLLGVNGVPLPDGPGSEAHRQRVLDRLRSDLVLIESRSVGWSVAEVDPEINENAIGLVRFYDYKVTRYDADSASAGDDYTADWFSDTAVRVELQAEGIKNGRAWYRDSGGTWQPEPETPTSPRVYTRQFFRPSDPALEGQPLPGGAEALDQPERWEFTADVTFLKPRTGGLIASVPSVMATPTPDPDFAVTYHFTKRAPAQPEAGEGVAPLFARPVESTVTIHPPVQQRPGGPWYYPVERQVFSKEDGKLVRTMNGLVLNPIVPRAAASPDPLESLSHSVTIYDGDGRMRHQVADIQPTDIVPDTLNKYRGANRPPQAEFSTTDRDQLATIPLPSGWEQINPNGPSYLNYVTTYLYNGPENSLSDVFYPNGRRWARRVISITRKETVGNSNELVWNKLDFDPEDYAGLDSLPRDRWFAREYVFNEVEQFGTSESPILNSRVRCEIRDYQGARAVGVPSVVRKVFFAGTPGTGDYPTPIDLAASLSSDPNSAIQADRQPRFIQEQATKFALDPSNQSVQADLLEANAAGELVAVGSKRINNLVDLIREQNYDGTITRTIRNLLGQTTRVYVGTDDDGWPGTHNLALTERIKYGTGVKDTWQPTEVRKYTRNPAFASTPYSDPVDDPHGFTTETFYDWRMRAVKTVSYGEGPGSNAPVLSTTFTYLDHADRPIVIATFGFGAVSLTSELDPSTRLDFAVGSRPDVHALFSLNIKPISVVETFYSAGGHPVERRNYSYEENNGTLSVTHHAEYSYIGRGGQVVYEQRPESPVSLSRVDGLGRIASTSSVVGQGNATTWRREIARSDLELDSDGNVCATARFERLPGTADEILTANPSVNANAVRTRTANWYDPQKRLTASADFGAETSATSNMLVRSAPQFVRGLEDPAATEPRIEFDLTGFPTGINRIRMDASGGNQGRITSIDHYSMVSGRLTLRYNLDGTFTKFEYGRAGRLARQIDNAYPTTGPSRTNEYEYTLGRLTGIIAYRSPAETDKQVTRVVYGCRVLEQGDPIAGIPTYTVGERPLHHASWIGRMYLPNRTTGVPPGVTPQPPHLDQAMDQGDVAIRYTFDGLIAERRDERGVVFQYHYDALRRLSWILVGSYDAAGAFRTVLPATMSTVAIPVDRVMATRHVYDNFSRLTDVIALSQALGETHSDYSSKVIAHTRYVYDTRGNLLHEYQHHGSQLASPTPPDTRNVEYKWSYAPTLANQVGFNRLEELRYPSRATTPNAPLSDRRTLYFIYGRTDGSLDEQASFAMSRLTAIETNSATGRVPFASFEFAGVSRRAGMVLGANSLKSSLVGEHQRVRGLTGLDSFGQLRDLKWNNSAPAAEVLFRAEYSYDLAGNRLTDVVTQSPAKSLNVANTQEPPDYRLAARSQQHQYDRLNRLVESKVGIPGPGFSSWSVLREDYWALDDLGNWESRAASSVPPGRRSTGNLDGNVVERAVALSGASEVVSPFSAWHDPCQTPNDNVLGQPSLPGLAELFPAHNARNEVSETRVTTDAGSPPLPTEMLHDKAGNLIFDGTYVYQYDAWNRLIQVNAAAYTPGSQPAAPGGPPETLDVYAGLIVGPLIKHYTYDGLGRLVRTQSPFPAPSNNTTPASVRSERHYYDGVRRILDLRLDPIVTLTVGAQSENNAVQQVAEQSIATTEATSSETPNSGVETDASSMQLETGLETGDIGGEIDVTPIQPNLGVSREYVWGPGSDAWHPATVDELLAYFDGAGNAWYTIQDGAG
ncbi:MAG: hypothetical protein SFZ23_13395, partial [Planctomycetota bacterium]|nr:hypothetical protein [Planctomycetota bacterium]